MPTFFMVKTAKKVYVYIYITISYHMFPTFFMVKTMLQPGNHPTVVPRLRNLGP